MHLMKVSHSLRLLAVLLCTLSRTPAQPAPHELWSRSYDGPPTDASDQASKVVRDPSGNFIVGGQSSTAARADATVLKYSGDGTLLWRQTYASTNQFDSSLGLLQVDQVGNVLAVINLDRQNTVSNVIVKFAAATGTLQWSQSFEPPTATALAVDPSGDLFVTGIAPDAHRFPQLYTAKYAGETGAMLWFSLQTDARPPAGSSGRTLALDPTGDVIVGGNYGSDFYVVKYARQTGRLLWDNRATASLFPANAEDLIVDRAGDVVASGSAFDQEYYTYTAKFRGTDGVRLWENRHRGSFNRVNQTVHIGADSNRDVFLASTEDGTFFTVKLSGSTGELLWEKQEPGNPTDLNQPAALIIETNNDVVVAGTVGADFIARYRGSDGGTVWARQNTFGAADNIRDLIVEPGGDLIIAGYITNTNKPLQGFDFQTARLSGDSSALMWQTNYNAQGPSLNVPKAAGIDSLGNVIVAVRTDNHFYTVKYATDDSRILWERPYAGPGNLQDMVSALALDSHDNVIVTGSTESLTNGYRATDIYTAKYAASGGALLWEHLYNGPDNLNDAGIMAAVDSKDNVVVSGNSRSLNNWDDIYTAKYNGTNGALLWERRYNGPYSHMDDISAMLLDAHDDVVVTGTSLTRGTNLLLQTDIYTAKYSGLDGSILWEQRYSSPTNGSTVISLGFDPQGDVIILGSSSCPLILKYSAGDGRLLWQQCLPPFNGRPLNPVGLVIDPNGNLYAGLNLGRTLSNHFVIDTAILGLDPDGQIRWEKTYLAAPLSTEIAPLGVDLNGDLILSGIREMKPGDFQDLFYTKLDGANGTTLWEATRPQPMPSAWAVRGNRLAVAGFTDGGFLTVAYQEDLTPRIRASYTVDSLTLSWPNAFVGWILEARNAPPGLDSPSTWSPLPQSAKTNLLQIPVQAKSPEFFYRLRKP